MTNSGTPDQPRIVLGCVVAPMMPTINRALTAQGRDALEFATLLEEAVEKVIAEFRRSCELQAPSDGDTMVGKTEVVVCLKLTLEGADSVVLEVSVITEKGVPYGDRIKIANAAAQAAFMEVVEFMIAHTTL